MEAGYYIDTFNARKFSGLRLPKIPFSADGAPILPATGDFVVILSTMFVVTRVVWHMTHIIENCRVTVYLELAERKENASNST